MEDSEVRTVSTSRARPRRFVGAMLALTLACGCAGRYKAPRTLAGLGTVAVIGGGAAWATGQQLGSSPTATSLVDVGFVAVALGIVAIVTAGGWMAAKVACNVDPDCDDNELCREIPAPPGGVPYKQCMAR
jgi:hypothetical protein